MTREEFESLLEEAFMAGYEDAIDEIFEEDNTFDLEDEMDSYLEARDDTKFDRLRKAAIRGDSEVAKELGFSKQARSNATRAFLAATGKGDGARRAKSFAKYASRLAYDAVKDSKKVGKNLYNAGIDAAGRAAEMRPELEKLDKNKNIQTKFNVAGRLLKKGAEKYKDIIDSFKNRRRNGKEYTERDDRKYLADKVKRAIERKHDRENQAARNRERNELYKKNDWGDTPYTKSGKFYNDNGKQGKKAIY